MKVFTSALIFCILGIFPLAAGGGRQTTPQRPANSAAIVTTPGQLPVVNQPLTLTLGIQQSPNVNDYDDTYFTRYMERKTGIKINFQMFSNVASDSNTQFELMVSSNERLPDIMNFSVEGWENYGANGVFIDLNPLYEKYAYFYNVGLDEGGLDAAGKKLVENRTTAPDGGRYAWPTIETNGVNIFYGMNFINQVWLNNLGLRMPTTTEEFYNILVAFRDRDPNRNGQRDEIPWIGSTGVWSGQPLHFIINAFVYYPITGLNEAYLNATNGRLWTPWTTEEYRQALRYLNRLFNEGLLSPSIFTITQQELVAITSYQSGEVNRVGFFSGGPTVLLVPETPAIYDYTNQVSLTGPNGVNYYSKRPEITVQPRMFITRDCYYPEAAFRWMDTLHDIDTTMTIRYGEKDVDWRWVSPGEGLVNQYGLPAEFLEISTIWGVPQNKHWSVANGITIRPNSASNFLQGGRAIEGGTWNADRWKLMENLPINDGKDVPEKVIHISYTRAEEDSIREIRNSINTYREECLALFCTGEMSLDRDWNTYLSTLDRIGLQRYLQTAQTAYTRTMSR